MGTTGKNAWAKHFKGKGNINTVMAKDSPLLDINGKKTGNIKKGEDVVFVATKEYFAKTPIKYKRKDYFVSFNNIAKPIGRGVSGVKLKPQHFKFFTKEEWNAKALAKELINEVEDRTDLDGDLRTFLIDLTSHWGGLKTVRESQLKLPKKGLNEVNKDYGEMLGAMACVSYGILAPEVKVGKAAKLNFPLRGNEPIVDYYILDGRKKYSVSAKSGTTTNTLKPQDVRSILQSRKEWKKWERKDIAKIINIISDNPTSHFPWLAINIVEGKKILDDKTVEAALQWKAKDFQSRDYVEQPFSKLKKLVSTTKGKLDIGELYYQTEAYIVKKMNKIRKYDPTDIFVNAVSGNVIYVKYEITAGKKLGKFEVMMPDANKDETIKRIKWRTKNTSNRASDKVGLQP